MKNIIWLASYPKSGNTWFRSFISALITQKEIDLNALETDSIFSGKVVFENVLDIDADDVPLSFIQSQAAQVFQYKSEHSKKNLFIKIHDAFTYFPDSEIPLIPTENVKVAIYLIRNPLDVSLSMANHIGKSVDISIDKYITNEGAHFVRKKPSPNNQFYQPLMTWSMHVESWLKQDFVPVYFVRYEDMLNQPLETFKKAVEVMGYNYSDDQIKFAINETQFQKLKAKEDTYGFKEKPIKANSFFNKGIMGRWKEELSIEQIEKIKLINEPMMRKFGYWDV